MKKAWKALLAALLAAVMVFGLVACNDNPEGPGTGGNGGNGTKIEIAGTYKIDLSPFMQLTIYLKVEENGNFKFSDTKAFEKEKSSGTVSKVEDAYLMLYKKVNGSDVTGETCNLTKETNGNLKFVGKILYGTVTINSPMQNEDTEEDVYFYAVPATNDGEEGESETLEIGLYYGADGIYQYYLNLLEGGSFTAFVSYEMQGMGAGFAYDYGTYTKMGAMCRMTSSVYKDKEDTTKPLTESVTVDSEGVVKADVKLSPFAKDTKEITVSAVKDEVGIAATFTGTKTMTMGGGATFNLEMTVLMDGSYTFTSTDAAGENEPYTETGFIGIEGMLTRKGVLIPQGMNTPGEVIVDENGAITIKIPVVQGTPRGDVTLTPVSAA